MSENPLLNLYNPASQSPEQLLELFIDRKNLLQRILTIIRANSPDRPQQHLILLGPRGMGKTTLLTAIHHSVIADASLNADWIPVQFYEEQYGIGDLADFWLEAIRHLETALHRPPRIANNLLDSTHDDLAETAQAAFLQLLADTSKRALLLIDNLNDIFNDIDDGHALHRLRALWMTDPRIMVIGAAPSYFEKITSQDQAFYDFFRNFSLERLTQEEMQSFLRRIAEHLNDTAVIQLLEHAPERVAALRILTGGNPRLVKLGYRVLRDGLDGDIRQDLERLLDESTPFFKHRIDSLAKEARRAFDAIARRWDPISVDDIRRELRKPSNYVSAQIKRLIDDGFVEEVGGDKKKRYQVSERFYNVYYLMRHSREGRSRLRWLVGFMQTFYSSHDYKNWAQRLGAELATPMAASERSDKLAHLHALCDASDGDGHDAAFEVLVQDAINHNDRRALDEQLVGADPIEAHGWRYLLAEIVWLLPVDSRRALGFKPNTGSWFKKLRRCLNENNLLDKAETRWAELETWCRNSPRHTNVVGFVLETVFLRHEQAETAYRKSIELDAQSAITWNNLGNTLSKQNRYQEAEDAYLKAIELDSQYVYAWTNLGNIFYYQNRLQEAENAYHKANELNPQDIYTWKALSKIHIKQYRYQDAETDCRKAIKLESSYVGFWNILGTALNGQSRYEEAEAAYLQAIEVDKYYVPAWINLSGTYLFALNRPDAGIPALLRGLSLDSEYAYGRYVLANHWQAALPAAVEAITSNKEGADNLRTVFTETLLQQAASGEQQAVRTALEALNETGQLIFEPLLLALQALDDRSILYRIASEKRELVQDVMAQLEATQRTD